MEYIIEDFKDIKVLQKQYPDLIFYPIIYGIYIVQVPETAEYQIQKLVKEVKYARMATLYGLNSEEALQDAGILVFHDYPFGELRGDGILLGFVDTGIDYTNYNFRFEDGSTRIVSLWDQSIQSENHPEGFAIGTEYTRENINDALQNEDPLSVVPSKDSVGHGTFLAGVAGGKDRSGDTDYIGAAPDAEFLIVRLKEPAQGLKDYYFLKEGVPAYSDSDVLMGMHYIIEKAAALQKPLVLCVGVGNNDGAHDGTNIIERYLDEITFIPGIAVVVATGNEANAGHHYKNTLQQGETKTIELNVAENENGFILQIWSKSVDKLLVSMRTPIGQIVEQVPLRPYKQEEISFTLQESRITITYAYPEINTGGQLIAIRFDKPIPGSWQIDVYGEFILNGNFDAWLPHVGFIEFNTRFSEPNTESTICIPATSKYVISVGAYDYIDGSLYAGSGRGSITNGYVQPDLIAPGINVVGPDLIGGTTSLIGTSTSAAIASGAAALLMEWAITKGNLPTINTRIMSIILNRGAKRRKGVVYPNNIEGYGQLNLENALATI
ncbi:hypothetical protein AN639_10730 [Candidatus Epulonipiscium fishelsonii]|uniref:Uncharacterized protein n=1 Tax=Candidatus Epulonipiscium fishelsonii TaxID=77094 RepID=A0ACC8XFP6_9FIRM|nr:hypothetical protein AN396_00485 [Epulopiscium sp. SCG-B11WGA-EpuloA1]ONI43278.1 hypothetical protein AN639_10730 [Epulopiscium sp. SCG-B05WGA-EpuloA1]ONI47703.1 hypothetical protein AN644_04265 [Epulopiscium sp. SCG-C06WGA-EpuloA1]